MAEIFFDVAFQTWIAKNIFPGYNIESYLMLIDKSKVSTGIVYQYFKLHKNDSGRTEIKLTVPIQEMDLGEKILTKVDVTNEVNTIFDSNIRIPNSTLESQGFDQWVEDLSLLVKHKKSMNPNYVIFVKNVNIVSVRNSSIR